MRKNGCPDASYGLCRHAAKRIPRRNCCMTVAPISGHPAFSHCLRAFSTVSRGLFLPHGRFRYARAKMLNNSEKYWWWS
jgi:hypothetical protein